ncbi:hypothetical protein F3Y22_tig00110156pilonHSYRG00044 [Hibiscus syriacus]|uniref:Uncharacterized protein n=1 Tax=Hibiscus syriacus TaxID=106335 RepID=A0A6A3BH12_HIBSY|nr:hypothetical protein F3Y22_tig00110156pilonHSYRG00044 [Hibiscus syriacus]
MVLGWADMCDVYGGAYGLPLAASESESITITALMKIYAFEIAAGRKVDMLPEIAVLKFFQHLLARTSKGINTQIDEGKFDHGSYSITMRFLSVFSYDLAVKKINQAWAGCQTGSKGNTTTTLLQRAFDLLYSRIEPTRWRTVCQFFIGRVIGFLLNRLQQCAYELQAVIGLDAHAVECIMPSDASCEDIEVDKGLSFLDGYIQEAIEKGAQPYIPDSERSGVLNMDNFRSQDHHESSHGLRLEAYELPKPAVQSRIPQTLLPSTEIVPVPEPVSTYTPETSTSNSTSQKTVNGAAQVDGPSTVNYTCETYASRKPQVEISHEKQKLAASLFGGSSKLEKRPATGHKVSKASSHMVEKSHVPNSSMELASEKTAPAQPPPDLLDLGEPTGTSTAPSLDPFKQLEDLLDITQDASAANGATAASGSPDVMALYADTHVGIHNKDDADLLSGMSNPYVTNMPGATARSQPAQGSSKGSNPKDSLEKDALVRQMGVNPSSQPKLVQRFTWVNSIYE